jgi:hypothetical protein
MAFGYKPNTAAITSSLNNILESRERRQSSEQASEERILGIQRDAFESDRTYNTEIAEKIKSNLDGLLKSAKDNRHSVVQSFRDKHMSPFYEEFQGMEDGFSQLKAKLSSKNLADSQVNELAGLIWSAGVNQKDPVPVIEFAEMLDYEAFDNDNTSFENSLTGLGILHPDISQRDDIYDTAQDIISSNREVFDLNAKLDEFYKIHPEDLSKNISDYDMGQDVEWNTTKLDGNDDGDGGGGPQPYTLPFTTESVESVFDMDLSKQREYFKTLSAPFSSPSYSYDFTEEAINSNLSINAQYQLEIPNLVDYYEKISGEPLVGEDLMNLNKLITLKQLHLQEEADDFRKGLETLSQVNTNKLEQPTEYGYMGKFGDDAKSVGKTINKTIGDSFRSLGTNLKDNQYATAMKNVIRAKSQLGNADRKVRDLERISVDKRRSNYESVLVNAKENLDRLQNNFEVDLSAFNQDYETNFSIMSIPYLEKMQHKGRSLTKDNSPSDIMRRKTI